ncbi:MAG: response regulator [Alsobacter sp.]
MTDSGGGSDRLTVLLVEDEPLIALTIAEILDECGYDVLEAGSGALAERLFAEAGRVDLLVTDVGLPDISGLDLARRLRALSPALPVLFATGRSVDGLQGDDPLEPPMAQLSKPFLMNELQDAISRLLAQRV